MIRVQFVDPACLPPRIPAIAVHRPGDITFVMRRGLTCEQLAHWIGRLGAGMTREAVDATVPRGQAAPQSPMRM